MSLEFSCKKSNFGTKKSLLKIVLRDCEVSLLSGEDTPLGGVAEDGGTRGGFSWSHPLCGDALYENYVQKQVETQKRKRS